MPVEGRARRLQTPLGRADRRFIALIGCAGAIAIGGTVYAYAGQAPSPVRPGCVSATIASSLGGATVTSCGGAARRFCRVRSARDHEIAAACRRQGFLGGRRRPARRKA
ncbi:MAG: hypothetical protein ACXVZO_00740 [Gaiellaceae bacterium]